MSDSEQEYSDLLHRAQTVRDLKAHPGWAILQDFVIHGPKGTANLSKRILNGLSKDTYQEDTGFLKGVDHVFTADDQIERLAQNLRGRLDAA